LNPEVFLRNVTQEDLPVFFSQQLDPEATRMAAFPARDRDAFTAHWTKIMADPSVILKTILWNGEVAGNIGSWVADGRRLIGYWIGKGFWGHGIATGALAAFIEQVPSRPLHAFVAKHNVASIRVLQKCGFVVIGEDQGAPGPDGEPIVDVLFELGTASVPYDAEVSGSGP
jgi:RimJ/RimL family protein N-acetyltransferase